MRKAAGTADLMLALNQQQQVRQKRSSGVQLTVHQGGKSGHEALSAGPAHQGVTLKKSGVHRAAPRARLRLEGDETDAMPAGHAVSWSALWSGGETYPSYFDALSGHLCATW